MMPKCPSKEDDGEVTYDKYEVTLEEARDGLLKALMYLKSTPSIPFYHVQMLCMVLYHFDECRAKHQEDRKQYYSEISDNSTQSKSLGRNQTSSLVDPSSDTTCINKNYCRGCKEEDIKNEGNGYVNGRISFTQVTTDSISDNNKYVNESTSEGLPQSCENGRMGLVGKCVSHLSWLIKTFPDSVAIGKSTLMSKQCGVFVTKPVSSGFKWGPYKLVDVQAALFRRNNTENSDDGNIPWLAVYLLVCPGNSRGQGNSNVKMSIHSDQMFIVTTKNISSGTELQLASVDPVDELEPVMHGNTAEWGLVRHEQTTNSVDDLSCCRKKQGTLLDSKSLSSTSLQSQFGEQDLPAIVRQSCGHPASGKTSVEKGDANCHTNNNSREEPHKCFVCGQRFNQVSKLNRHVTVHYDMDASSSDLKTIRRLLPEGLAIMRSTVQGVKWGIFTKSKVQAGICWGPSLVSNKLRQVMDESSAEKYHDDTRFLWLQYIRFTNNEHLQNIRIKREGHGVYYISTKDIPPDNELLVGISGSEHLGEKNPRLKLIRCGICNKRFSDASELSTHRLLYCAERPCKCGICHRSFLNSELLTKHEAIHKRPRLHMCTVCGKGFRMSKDLRRHQLVHTGERPYRCTVCGKGFTQQGSIKRHMVVHTGEKQYICDVCGKDFTDSSHFRRHQKIHFGRKSHICSICDKAFLYADKLRTHIRIHTGEKPYHCAVCGKEFACDSSFSKHKKTHTGATCH